jgi:hypothetical protein
VNDGSELEQTLETAQHELKLLEERLAHRDAVALAPVETQRARVEVLEREHDEVSQRLEFHQRELELLQNPPPSAIRRETLVRLGAAAWVVAAATQGLGTDGATLWGLSAVGCLLALMWGYFRG